MLPKYQAKIFSMWVFLPFAARQYVRRRKISSSPGGERVVLCVKITKRTFVCRGLVFFSSTIFEFVSAKSMGRTRVEFLGNIGLLMEKFYRSSISQNATLASSSFVGHWSKYHDPSTSSHVRKGSFRQIPPQMGGIKSYLGSTQGRIFRPKILPIN